MNEAKKFSMKRYLFLTLIVFSLTTMTRAYRKTAKDRILIDNLCKTSCSDPKKTKDTTNKSGLCPQGVCKVCLANGVNTTTSNYNYCKENSIFLSAPIRLFPYSFAWFFSLPKTYEKEGLAKNPSSKFHVTHKDGLYHSQFKQTNFNYECPGDSFLIGFVTTLFEKRSGDLQTLNGYHKNDLKYQALCAFFETRAQASAASYVFDKTLLRKSDCDIISPASQSSLERYDIAPSKKEDMLSPSKKEDMLRTEDVFSQESEVQCDPGEFLHGIMSTKFNIFAQNPDGKDKKNKDIKVPDFLPRMFQGLCCKTNIHYISSNSKEQLGHLSYDKSDCQDVTASADKERITCPAHFAMVGFKSSIPDFSSESEPDESKRSFTLNCCRINSLAKPKATEAELQKAFNEQTCNTQNSRQSPTQ